MPNNADERIEAHDRQIEGLIKLAARHGESIERLASAAERHAAAVEDHDRRLQDLM